MTAKTVQCGDLLYLYLGNKRDIMHECIISYDNISVYEDSFFGIIKRVPLGHSSTISCLGAYVSCSCSYIDWEKSTLLNQNLPSNLIGTLDI